MLPASLAELSGLQLEVLDADRGGQVEGSRDPSLDRPAGRRGRAGRNLVWTGHEQEATDFGVVKKHDPQFLWFPTGLVGNCNIM